MNRLLELQEIDGRIGACRKRESEIPKQKNKFNIQRERLKAELAEREQVLADLELEQRDCESEIEQRKEQAGTYQGQLNLVKKNEEYQALLHEIDQMNKQIGVKEERILTIMIEMDDAKARLDQDRKRIKDETDEIDKECGEIDTELAEAVKNREVLERERKPLAESASGEHLTRYTRLRTKYRTGAIVVPLRDEVCTGCNMHLRAQIVNEVLEGSKLHSCQHCGRLLYYPGNVEGEATVEQLEAG